MGGQCLTKKVIYNATVTQDPDSIETYVGLTGNIFKKKMVSTQIYLHITSATLSQHIWKLKDEEQNCTISWKFVGRAKPFSTISGLCQLCTKEKYHIIYEPCLGSLNSRNEVTSCCRHTQSQLFRKYDPNIHKT